MILRINPKEVNVGLLPASVGQNLTLVNLGVTLTLNGTQIFTTNDFSTSAFPTGTTPDGVNYTVARESNQFIKVTLSDVDGYSSDAKYSLIVTLTSPSHISYTNTFELYEYDLGNNPAVNNFVGNPINYNQDFSIVLVQTSVTQPFASTIAYRKPFTDLVFFYTGNSGIVGTRTYTDELSNNLNATYNGFVCNNKISKTIIQNCTLGVTTTTGQIVVAPLVWFPDANTFISTSNQCNDGNSSILSTNFAQVVVDYTTVSSGFLNDVAIYYYSIQEIDFSLYDNGGNLIDSNIQAFNLTAPPFNYNPTTYQYIFYTPNVGDYILKVDFKTYGIEASTIYASGNLQQNKYYKVLNNGGGFNVMNLGGLNFVGSIFRATSSGTPTSWGSGSVVEITPTVINSKSYPIHTCHWYEIEQSSCSDYIVYNRSFENVVLNVFQLTALNTWTLMTDFTNILIDALGNTTVSIPTDGVYQFQVTILQAGELVGSPTDTSYSYIIPVYCNLLACISSKVNDILCGETIQDCKDLCKEVYDFNALIINAHTYFNILNKQFNFSYIYTTLDSNTNETMWQLQQFLDSFTNYCSTCSICSNNDNCGCPSCS